MRSATPPQLLNESEDLQPADARLTNIIINHCNRMNGVVENVLEMSRRKTPEPMRVNLKDHIDEFVCCVQAVPPGSRN